MRRTGMISLEGKVFGLLTVVRREGTYRKYAAWLCRCTCGLEVVVCGDHLRCGRKKSCARNGHTWAGAKYPPGFIKKYRSEHRSWEHMLARCRQKGNRNWKNYGGRGITVCARWKDFNLFVADMGRKPTPRYTIERKDLDRQAVYGRLKNGWSLEAALSIPVNKHKNKRITEWKNSVSPLDNQKRSE